MLVPEVTLSVVLALLVEILAIKFCPSAVVPALQSIWFYNKMIHVIDKKKGYNSEFNRDSLFQAFSWLGRNAKTT